MLLLLWSCAETAQEKPDISQDTAIVVDRGPTTVLIDGDPNGLYWSNNQLYIADDNNNRILKWTDAAGIGLVGDLPDAAAEGAGLGQLVVQSDGTIVVTRFGYGTSGDVVTLSADGQGSVVPRLDRERRRIGLALAADGSLYDSWFISGGAAAVSALDLSGQESNVISSLGKPVGVLAVGDNLFVSDQDTDEILQVPLSSPRDVSVFAQVMGPDLLCEGPAGSLFTGGREGDVRQIGADGSVQTVGSGYQEVRGVAYDAEHGRLFFVDHDGDDSDGVTNYLQIIPVN